MVSNPDTGKCKMQNECVNKRVQQPYLHRHCYESTHDPPNQHVIAKPVRRLVVAIRILKSQSL